MYEDKKKSWRNFEGPVLCNGFIDDAELDKAQLRKEIYVSVYGGGNYGCMRVWH